MKFNRYVVPIALLVLLSACGDSGPEKVASAPEAPAEAAMPAADTAALMANEVAAAGDNADLLYARACAACHGETAEGVGDFPSLAKLSRDVVEVRLQAYRAGETVGPKSALMAPVAKPLSDEQIAALALYLGS